MNTAHPPADATAVLHAAISARREFDADQFRRAWLTAYTFAGLAAASLLLNVVQFVGRDKPLPIAVTPDWRVVQLTPLSEASLSDEGVRNWAARTIPSLYSLDFRNSKQQIANLSPVFTEAGYQGYLEALKRNELIEVVRRNNFVVSAVPRESPQVVGRSKIKDAVVWKIRAPITVTFDNGSTPVTQNLMVTAFIMRVPETRNPFGVQIHSFSAARE